MNISALFPLLIGCALDLLLGDPVKCPHIVVGIGKLITLFEMALRHLFPKSEKGELAAGLVLAAALPLLTGGAAWGLLALAGAAHPLLRLGLSSLLCWQCLALRSLVKAGRGIEDALRSGDLPLARRRVSMVVGRDTDRLDGSGVARACVETVAENVSDGVVAPMLFMVLGGAPLGVLYKAINTMDSMIGYKNRQYLFFGRAAAKLDDAANFLPARLAGLLMIPAAALCGLDFRGAGRIFFRDRLNHKSPNSAHTEAAAAGALGVQLGGDNFYFGEIVRKPTIGDDLRPIEAGDISRVSRQAFWTSALCLLLSILIRGTLICLL